MYAYQPHSNMWNTVLHFFTFFSERNCIPQAICVAILRRSRDVSFRWMGGLSLPGRTVYIFSWPLVDLRNPSRSPWHMYSIIMYIGPVGRRKRRRRRRRRRRDERGGEGGERERGGRRWGGGRTYPLEWCLVELYMVYTHFQQCRLWSAQPHWGVAQVEPAPPSPAKVLSHTHHRQCTHLWVRKQNNNYYNYTGFMKLVHVCANHSTIHHHFSIIQCKLVATGLHRIAITE